MADYKRLVLGAAALMLSLPLWAQAPVVDAETGPVVQFRPAGNDMYGMLQQLQAEVMELRGKVEEQAHQIRQLKQESLDRYIELDRRLGAGGATKPAPKPVASRPARPAPAAAAPRNETDAYREAYNLVRAQKFGEAIPAFKGFIEDFPSSRYTPNAWYWLGELYLVKSPQQLDESATAFNELLQQFPNNSKVPDAMYKLGKVKFLQGDSASAKGWLEKVTTAYPESSAAKLAKEFLRQSF